MAIIALWIAQEALQIAIPWPIWAIAILDLLHFKIEKHL